MPGVAGRGDAAEGRRAQEVVRQVEVWMVEEIEGLGAKLKIYRFAEMRVLHQRHVDVLITRTTENVATGIAEGARSRERKRARVEPLRRRRI